MSTLIRVGNLGTLVDPSRIVAIARWHGEISAVLDSGARLTLTSLGPDVDELLRDLAGHYASAQLLLEDARDCGRPS